MSNLRSWIGIAAVLLGLIGGPACIIGTWPTPENSVDSAVPVGQPSAEEQCDDLDNDADGVVDEGCPCHPLEERGCIGIKSGQCGLGVQHCVGGLWGTCAAVGPPWSAERPSSVTIVDVSPTSLSLGGTESVTVQASVTAPCAGIQVLEVRARLAAVEPTMSVWDVALDDGVAPDVAPADGTFAATLRNVFGPGVPAQSLALEVEAKVGARRVVDTVAVELGE